MSQETKKVLRCSAFFVSSKGGFEKEAAEHAEQKRWHAKAKMIPLDHFSDVARESPVSQERKKSCHEMGVPIGAMD